MAVCVCLLAVDVSLRAANLPDGLTETPFAVGLTEATAMAFAPDGRLFVCQQEGQLCVIKNNAWLSTPFLSVSVDPSGERGLLGSASPVDRQAGRGGGLYYLARGSGAVFKAQSIPSISINDVQVVEGNSGTTPAAFIVTLSTASTQTVSVSFATFDNTATSGSDYQSASGTLTFAPGETSKTITVQVNGDTLFEPDETFFINLAAPTNATIADGDGIATITNDDPAPLPTPTPITSIVQFSSAQFNVTEDCTGVSIGVTRIGALDAGQSVEYVTHDGTAAQKGDFIYAEGRLSFAAGEATKTFSLLVNEDAYAEGNESLTLELRNPAGGTSLGTQSTSTLLIVDDETINGTTNPSDTPRAFVCQQYHDFLNRQPDQPGEDFWTSQIESCGSDAACIQEKRTNVSAAFFLSGEFQRTGYLVTRAHKAAFGSAKSNPRYTVFLRDQREISEGVVIGEAGADARLEQNTRKFFEEFVQRPEYVAQFPLEMSVDAYLNKLFANSGVTPTPTERVIAGESYSNDPRGRAIALRSVVESDSVFQKQYNPSFVLLQYFGYLRRNPDEAPNTDFSGYDFWLNKLNQFSLPGENVRNDMVALGRAKRAEMVKSFIVSGEYRARFGR